MNIWKEKSKEKEYFVRFGAHPTRSEIIAWLVDDRGDPIFNGVLLAVDKAGVLLRSCYVDETPAQAAGIALNQDNQWKLRSEDV